MTQAAQAYIRYTGTEAGTSDSLPNPQSAIRNPQSGGGLPPPPVGWLTAGAAAEVLGLTDRSVRRRCRDGRLPGGVYRGVYGSGWFVNPSLVPSLLIAAGEVEAPLMPATCELAGLSEAQRRRAHDRLVVVRAYAEARADWPAGDLAARTSRWCEAYSRLNAVPVVPRTLLRWWSEYGREGLSALVDRRGRPGVAEYSPDAMEFILAQYLDEARPNATVCWERAEAMRARMAWVMPSLRTARRYIAKHAPPALLAAGRDPKRFRDRCVPDCHRDWSRVAAMECWIADHRLLDVMVPHAEVVRDRHAATGKSVRWSWHRPWLTMFMDARTWKPVAWAIRFEDPSAQQVMSVFCAGVERWGKPASAYLDNGRDFRARRFAGGRKKPDLTEEAVRPILDMLGIEVHWAWPYNAKSKPIEPWFRLMSERFDRTFATYIGNRMDRKPERFNQFHGRAEQYHAAGLTIEAVADAFGRWVEDDYCQRECPVSVSKPYTVNEAFERLRDPAFTVVRPPAQDLALLLMRSRAIVVSKDGVWAAPFSAFYWADELEPLRCASGRDRDRHVAYRWRDGDPSRIYVFAAGNGQFLAVARPAPGNAIHPLARAGTADADRLAEAIEHKLHYAKTVTAQLTAVRAHGHEVLLGLQSRKISRDAEDARDRTPMRTQNPNPLHPLHPCQSSSEPLSLCGKSTVVSLMGAISQAAEAGRIEAEKDAQQERRVSAREFFSQAAATGTDDQHGDSPAHGIAGRSALNILADAYAAEDADAATGIRNPQSAIRNSLEESDDDRGTFNGGRPGRP